MRSIERRARVVERGVGDHAGDTAMALRLIEMVLQEKASGRESYAPRRRAVGGTIGGIGRRDPAVAKGLSMIGDKLSVHNQCIDISGEDVPETRNWK